MMTRHLKNGFYFLFALALLASCKKNDPQPAPPTDWTTARLLDFELRELDYSNISINHPQTSDGVETQPGTIALVLPAGTTNLQLTPLTDNFTNTAFTITPALGVVQNFANGPVVYTIASKAHPERKIRYSVTVTVDPGTGNNDAPEVTDFTFHSSKNPGLLFDFPAEAIVEEAGSFSKIYIFLPPGTDFSSLTPSITHNGTALFFSQDAMAAPQNSTATYPAAGQSTDFAYPKPFYLVVKKGTQSKVYDVIVDVANPLRLQATTFTAPAVQFGNSNNSVEATRLVNQGNHPVSLDPVTYSDQVPAGSSAIRALPVVPNGGLLPGQSMPVNVSISASSHVPGNYSATARFRPKIVLKEGSATYLLPAELSVNATITN